MEKIVTLNKSLDDAFNQAILAVEGGKFNKAIILLEYVEEHKQTYDEVMVNYILLISYYNTGNRIKALKCLEKFDILKSDNQQIINVVEQIRSDLKNKFDSNKVFCDDFLVKVFKSESVITDLAKKFPDDFFLNVISLPRSEQDYIIIANLVKQAFSGNDFFEKNFNKEGNYEINVLPLKLLNFFKIHEDNMFFWLMLEEKALTKFYNNTNISDFFKNYVTIQLIKIVNYDKLNEERLAKVTNLDKDQLTLNNELAKDLTRDITRIYNDEDVIDYDSVEAVVEIFICELFPKKISDMNYAKLVATIAYAINDVMIGRNYDSLIYKDSKIKFSDIKEEIKEFEHIFIFLLE